MDRREPSARLAVRVLRLSSSPAFAFCEVSDGAGVETMASVIGTYVPTYQGLSATDFVRSAGSGNACFPFDVPHRLPFYRARNAIYHVFRALIDTNPGLT